MGTYSATALNDTRESLGPSKQKHIPFFGMWWTGLLFRLQRLGTLPHLVFDLLFLETCRCVTDVMILHMPT